MHKEQKVMNGIAMKCYRSVQGGTHPGFSGGITTLTLQSTNFCAMMNTLIDQDGVVQ